MDSQGEMVWEERGRSRDAKRSRDAGIRNTAQCFCAWLLRSCCSHHHLLRGRACRLLWGFAGGMGEWKCSTSTRRIRAMSMSVCRMWSSTASASSIIGTIVSAVSPTLISGKSTWTNSSRRISQTSRRFSIVQHICTYAHYVRRRKMRTNATDTDTWRKYRSR